MLTNLVLSVNYKTHQDTSITVSTHFDPFEMNWKKSSNWLKRGSKRVKTGLNWFGWNVYPLKLLLLPTVSLAEISRSSSGEIIKGERNLSKSETPKLIILYTFKSIDFRQWRILLRRDSKLMFPDGLFPDGLKVLSR